MPRVRLDPSLYACNHRTPTPAEAGAAIAAMDEDDWKAAILLAAVTGARIGEVARLRRVDLELGHRVVVFGAVRGASKTGIRRVPIDAEMARRLAACCDPSREQLFDFRGQAAVHGLQRRLKVACRRVGVEPFTPHGLRRMVVTRLLRAGVDAGTAASLTGHSVQVMLVHYQQVSDVDRRDAAERAGLAILSDHEPRRSRQTRFSPKTRKSRG